MLGGEGLQGHFEKQIATWWRNWFSPQKMTAWCIIWLHAVRVLDRDNLSNPTGDLIVLTRATLSTFWLCACQGSSRQDPWGESSSVRSRYSTAHSSPFPSHPTLTNRQAHLFISSIIMNERSRRTPQLCTLYLCQSPSCLLVHTVLGDHLC